MRSPTILAITSVLLLGWGGASASDAPPLPDFEVATSLVPQDALPERETRWTDPAVTLTDVLYATLPGYRPLRLDLYRQSGTTAPQPLVVFLHGGGWAQANPRAGAAFRNFPAVLAALAKRGYVVASVEFRQSSEAPFPAQLDDVQAAIRFLRANAGRLGIDGSRVALWGMSSGAHLAALDAVHCAEGACVQALVGWFGPYDLEAYVREQPDHAVVKQLLRCNPAGCSAEALRGASPSNYVDAGDPPALLLQGQADAMSASQPTNFAARLRAAGVAADVVLLPGVKHGFVGQDEASTKAATKAALEATFTFLDRVLGAPSPKSR